MRSRLKTLISEKELQERRRITHQEIADAIGVRRATITKWMSPKPLGRIDDKVLAALTQWLNLEHVGQLLYVDHGDSNN